MRRVLLAFLFAVSTACHTARPVISPTRPEASIEALRNDKGAIVCTIFSINEAEHLWMTAHHCVVVWDMGQMTTQYASVYIGYQPATLYKDFPEIDVAIVHTETASAPALHLAAQAPKIKDPIAVIGHGLGVEQLTYFEGTVSTLHVISPWTGQFYTFFQMPVFGGHSGSPVMTPDGAVVSVMQIAVEAVSGGCTYEELVRLTGAYWR